MRVHAERAAGRRALLQIVLRLIAADVTETRNTRCDAEVLLQLSLHRTQLHGDTSPEAGAAVGVADLNCAFVSERDSNGRVHCCERVDDESTLIRCVAAQAVDVAPEVHAHSLHWRMRGLHGSFARTCSVVAEDADPRIRDLPHTCRSGQQQCPQRLAHFR